MAPPRRVPWLDSENEVAVPLPPAIAALPEPKPRPPPRDEELASALNQDAEERRYRGLGQVAADFTKNLTGVGYRPESYSPPEMGAVKRLIAQREDARLARRRDPTSPESRRLQAALSKTLPGAYTPDELAQVTLEDEPYLLDFAKVRSAAQTRAQLATEMAERQRSAQQHEDEQRILDRNATVQAGLAQRQFTAEENARGRGFQWAMGEANRKAQADLAETRAEAKGGPNLPSAVVESMANTNVAIQALNDLVDTFDRSGADGMLGKVQANLPFDSDARRFNDQALATAQAVGKILEGGKLAAGDEVKYRKLLPAPGDSKEQAHLKRDNLIKMLRQQKAATAAGFEAAGYKTPASAAEPVQVTPAPRRGLPEVVPLNGKMYIKNANGDYVEQ